MSVSANRVCRWTVILFACLPASASAQGAKMPLLLDCGTADSPLQDGYSRLTAADRYSAARGYGWETANLQSVDYTREIDWKTPHYFGFFAEFMTENLDPVTRDGVVSQNDLLFRADVSNGTYRVTVQIGDMTQAIGSMEMYINDKLVSERLAAWSPGGDRGDHRRLLTRPNGFYWKERHTVQVDNGMVRIRLSRNQQFYDQQIMLQNKEERAWENQFKPPPYKRIAVEQAPYYYCGWPFKRNAIMAIRIVPDKPLPVRCDNGKLRLTRPIESPALKKALEDFNSGNPEAAVKALDEVTEDSALAAKAIVALWLAGRLETEFDEDLELVTQASRILHEIVLSDSSQNELAELLEQAQHFSTGYLTHIHSGDDPLGEKNHFVEKAKTLCWFWLIPKDSPLYDQAQLNLSRAEHMLIPYFPPRGTYREILKRLEKKYPDNRFVKYHLHEVWENHGDGTHRYDWYLPDYAAKVTDSPDWVKWIYPAFQQAVDWCQWWITFAQRPSGTVGGGWGDDVEIVGVFGFYGFVGNDVSDILIPGTAKLMQGMWDRSAIDQELGFCVLLTDSEHSAEWTGNTLGMMCVLEYGNPIWIERSMKTGKLMRDLWTDFDAQGRRFFRSEYFCAAEVGLEKWQQHDVWINYRAIRPAHAVLWYNQNPAIGKLYRELGDAWVDASLSTDRGKPKGLIPGEISMPEGLIGGPGSITWYGARKEGAKGPFAFMEAGYKDYIRDVFFDAYQYTRNPKYLQPLRLEYELVTKYLDAPVVETGLRLQPIPEIQQFGVRQNDRVTPAPKAPDGTPRATPDIGSEQWAAMNIRGANQWLIARRMLEGRNGPLQNDMTKEDAIRAGRYFLSEMKWRYPLHTTEAGPTDRIGFVGMVNPFIVYTGGRIGGPLLEAAVTYENTTRDFAALVLGTDAYGVRLLYHSLTRDRREISLRPWHLERGGRYLLRYGPDADEDEEMDRVAEHREFDFPQLGTPVKLTVNPRVTYVVEIEQFARGHGTQLAPDPALTADDIRYTRGRIIARIHNVGSQEIRDVEVAAYEGDPDRGGKLIATVILPNIEAPLDLEPRTTSAGFPWRPAEGSTTGHIFLVIDPDSKIANEITKANNKAHAVIDVR